MYEIEQEVFESSKRWKITFLDYYRNRALELFEFLDRDIYKGASGP